MAQTDDYGRHEVLHMASFLMSAVETELVEHEAVRAEPEWLALAEAARKALFDLYQAIGLKHMPEGSEPVYDGWVIVDRSLLDGSIINFYTPNWNRDWTPDSKRALVYHTREAAEKSVEELEPRVGLKGPHRNLFVERTS